ncbi:MAG: sigma 54-interacting transcriptional regulator [Desulfuromonadales bacterium]|nr:sigma 54-interacting transcriptional regulator [Desulfuromonadales bacterium]
MATTKKLTSSQKDFFAKVAQAAFSNPFGETRLELDLQISETDHNLERMEITDRAIAEVDKQLQQLDKAGVSKLAHFGSGDAKLMHTAYLFEIYHQLQYDFDRHIQQQIKGGDKPQPVQFADKAMTAFYRRGFSELDACKYLAFFFQMRRAFYFIDQNLIGDCPSMRQFRCHLWNNLFTHDIKWFEEHLWDRMEDFSTLILGETGSGKGAAAAAIGCSGHIPFDDKTGKFKESFTKAFISRNLSQYPETLIESELFGHSKGAFTGAIGNYQGVFSQCTPHGAIFLDEIGELTTPVQIKLLQVLQERCFSPVGSHEKLRFSGRVIAATNRSIGKLRQQGKFRDDFFYRLCSDVITVPSLRQRVGENPKELTMLLERVIERIIGEKKKTLATEIKSILDKNLGKSYHWPGNVRELEQAVRRILLSGSYAGEQFEVGMEIHEQIHAKLVTGEAPAQELLCDYCKMLYQRFGTYEQVASTTGLDRRTVKKYIEASRLE